MKKLASAIFVGVMLFPATAAFADHGYYDERARCGEEYECYDEGRGNQDYDQWNNEDRNRNRNRNRGAFSPGPFDDSPVDAFNGNTICLPGSTCEQPDRQRDEQPPQ